MKKLLVVIHSLRYGGSERVLVNLLKGLKKEEFSITLVLYEAVFDLPCPSGVELEVLDIGASRNPLKMTAGFAEKIRALAGVIRRRRPDVVFSLLSSTNVTLLLAKLLSKSPCRVVLSEHTHPSVNLANELYGGVTKMFMKYLYPRADLIIAVSRGIRDDLVEDLKIPADRIAVIYNPVDIEEVRRLSKEEVDHPWFREEVPVVIAVGRVTKQKGYSYLIRAFSIVRKKAACRLVIVGDGQDMDKLRALVDRLGIRDDVVFLGFQRNPFSYMAKSSVFVLSSLYEGFGNVIVEAMALGLPVVSTDCPSGPSEIIDHGRNGLLVRPADEEGLAEAILGLLADKGRAEALAREAEIRARSFDLGPITEQYRGVLGEDSPRTL